MNCEEYKNLITIGVFGELTRDELTRLKAHLGECTRCAAAYERSIQLSDLCGREDSSPLPDKEKSWQIIAGRVFKKKSSPFEGITRPRPVVQYALVILLLVVSFAAGYLSRPDRIKGSQLAQLQMEIGQIRELAAASLLRQESLNMRLREMGMSPSSAASDELQLGYLFRTLIGAAEEDSSLSQREQASPLVDLALTLVRQINRMEIY